MRSSHVPAALAALAVLVPSVLARPRPQEDRQGLREAYLFHLGVRSLDDDAWEDIDEHTLLAFEGAYHPSGAGGLGIEYGTSFSGDETHEFGVEVTGTLLDLWVGGRFVLGDGPIYPLIGAGVSFVYADVEGEAGGFTVSDDDTTFGGYGHAGLFWRADSGFSIGVDGRLATTGEMELFDVDGDANYSQLALTLGWSR